VTDPETNETESQIVVEALDPVPRAASKLWIARVTSIMLVVGGWEYWGGASVRFSSHSIGDPESQCRDGPKWRTLERIVH